MFGCSPSPPVSPRLVTASWASRIHFSAAAIRRSTSSRLVTPSSISFWAYSLLTGGCALIVRLITGCV